MKNFFRIHISFLLLAILLTSHQAIGQNFRLGRVTTNDFIQGSYEKDPDASAVILFDKGRTSVEYDSNQGQFYYLYRKEMRLQILDERAFDWANFEISLYTGGTTNETTSNFSGFVHNLENNKVKTVKVTRHHSLTEQTSDTRRTIKYSFPEVKAGSIVEIGYTIRSVYIYSLPHWQFQYSIPVEYSEYEISIPEYYTYQNFMQGYNQAEYTQKQSTTTYTFTGRSGSSNVTPNVNNQRWIIRNLPAMREEPYTNNILNYVSLIRFELSSENFPGTQPNRFVSDWSDVDKRLQDSENFGGFLTGSRQLRQEMRELDLATEDETEKIRAVIQFIQNNIRWNNRNAVFASSNPRQVLRSGEGNAADVNLMLVAALRHMGFQANPVVTSTRNNGMVIQPFPTINRFNYVLASVVTKDGSELLLDATDPFCPPGMLPIRALNGQGRLITETNARWVELKPQFSASERKIYNFSIDQQGLITARAELFKTHYAAYSTRKSLENAVDLQKYKENYQSNFPGMLISQLDIENTEDIALPLVKKLDFTLSDGVHHAGDMIFFKPLLFEAMARNPFRLEERKFPIDFTYPMNEEITITYDIPQGFEVEFLPAAMQTHFKNKIFFRFSSRVNEHNQIEVHTIYEVRDHFFLPADYNGLKEFFKNMVEKHSEQITLKLTT